MSVSKTLKLRRGSSTTMASSSIVLDEGEIFVEYASSYMGGGSSYSDNDSSALKIKIGDGSTAYSSLPYAVNFGSNVPNASLASKVTSSSKTTTKGYLLCTASASGTAFYDTNIYTSTTAGTLVATTFSGALSGNATTATTATKLGSSTVGSATRHMYISSGTATASSSTVGSSTNPIYMSSGTFTACSSFFTSLITSKNILASSSAASSSLFTFSSSYTYFIFIAYYLAASSSYKEFLPPILMPYSGLSSEVMLNFPGYDDSLYLTLSCNISSGYGRVIAVNSNKLYFADILGLQI